jgi:hypothetical protein
VRAQALALDARNTGHWREIEVMAQPFKALGVDRATDYRTAQASADHCRKNNERIQRKLANHDRNTGRPAKSGAAARMAAPTSNIKYTKSLK